MKLVDILKSNIREAGLAKDVSKEKIAMDYINQIKSFIAEYKSDNRRIHVEEPLGKIVIQTFFKGLDIWITNIPRTGDTTAKYQRGLKGHDSVIKVYDSKISKDPKLTAEFDEAALRHEIIHHLDNLNIKYNNKLDQGLNKSRTDTVPGSFTSPRKNKYLNHGLELNAHFFELFMPQVMKYVENVGTLPGNVNDFIKDVIKDGETKDVFNKLTTDNKKKVMKRLGVYYDTLKNGAMEPDGKQVDDSKLKRITKAFIDKIKSLL